MEPIRNETRPDQTKRYQKEVLIEFLKTFNDTYAHLDGDDVIWISREHELGNMMNITYIDGRRILANHHLLKATKLSFNSLEFHHPCQMCE